MEAPMPPLEGGRWPQAGGVQPGGVLLRFAAFVHKILYIF